MRSFGVDKYGIKIMAKKGVLRLVKIETLSGIAANILKQEMLSLGGEAAVSRGSITGRAKATDCLIMGTSAQIERLIFKLRSQPLGLSHLASRIKECLGNYERDRFVVPCGKYRLNLGRRTFLMAVINLTPDSFSGDGLYNKDKNYILDYAGRLVSEGADIIDVGGESTRPGSRPVPVKEEIERTAPVIKKLAKSIKVPLSIDTYKPEVAQRALDAGASIVNNIMGVNLDSKMAKVVRRYNAGLVLMHIKGRPNTMQVRPQYNCLLSQILGSLEKAVARAKEFGIAGERIIVDPGIGFGKALEHNLEILKNLREFKVLGCPILVGPSRKSFIGKILGVDVNGRKMGTAASVSLAIANGAHIVRVHDVADMRQVARVCDAILN